MFKDMSERLSDGRPYLVAGTTSPTAADLTFAALAAPVICPDGYGGAAGFYMPKKEAMYPPTSAAAVHALAATPAGQHVVKMYAKFRHVGPAAGARSSM